MNRIADNRGISGYGEVVEEEIYEDTDLSLRDRLDAPVVMKQLVGYVVRKRGSVLQEDGSPRCCSYRTGICNVWQECVSLWTIEEMWTEGYTKQGKFPPKYDTKWKRRAQFSSELLKALGKADSKAWSKCVRELTGMKTGYSTEDLKEGKFYFAKIRRSPLALRAETAARLQAISQGNAPQTAQKVLFGPTEQFQKDNEPTIFPMQTESIPVQNKSKREEYVAVALQYLNEKQVPTALVDSLTQAVAWIEKTENADAVTNYWTRCCTILKDVEKAIPEIARITHNIF
jgi:hypothetical protein